MISIDSIAFTKNRWEPLVEKIGLRLYNKLILVLFRSLEIKN